ncbi:MAG: NADPH-dependent glutamate synthase [Gammaproteobacteria bacterium]|nr:NADPH-dependent glutamate synthase [Gammaproteobacteria bacterium]
MNDSISSSDNEKKPLTKAEKIAARKAKRKFKKTIKTIAPEKAKMPEQEPKIRARNFDEVSLGYTEILSNFEADRCLMCKKPLCISGCPVSINIPGFIQKIVEKDYREAYNIISESTMLPAVCGRVCPQEDQCEGICTTNKKLEAVGIGRLERWIGDMAIQEGWQTAHKSAPNGLKVAIIGSGPAGLACAADMAKAGCEVIIYEALHVTGGVLRYGIPEFRLPNSIVDAEIGKLEALGVKIECNVLVGRLFTIEQMRTEMGFDAVFIGTGAGYPRFMEIPGESLNGVLSANELLTRCNLMKAGDFPNENTPIHMGKKVAVIGSGNTAMDAMRVSLRLGAEDVYCVYRRTEEESPARLEEIHHAHEEGVQFRWLTNPLEILDDGNGSVRGMLCIENELGEPDESGRRRPVAIKGSEFEMEVDMVVYAIGVNANPIMGQTTVGLDLNQWGFIKVDDELQTSLPGVFAGGDIVTGAATVILAMGAGRTAAAGMIKFLGIANEEVEKEVNA